MIVMDSITQWTPDLKRNLQKLQQWHQTPVATLVALRYLIMETRQKTLTDMNDWLRNPAFGCFNQTPKVTPRKSPPKPVSRAVSGAHLVFLLDGVISSGNSWPSLPSDNPRKTFLSLTSYQEILRLQVCIAPGIQTDFTLRVLGHYCHGK
jgi:hypothetical protein